MGGSEAVSPDELRAEYTPTEMSRNQFAPEQWVHAPYTETYYAPYDRRGETGKHILRGSCDEVVSRPDGDGTCSHYAVVRRLSSDGVEEYCATHAPEPWMVALQGHRHIDDTLVDLEVPCSKWVQAEPGSRKRRAVTEEGDEPHDPGVTRCGDRAFITVTSDHTKAWSYCRRHARSMWYAPMERPTGVPPEYERYLVDAGYHSDADWEYVDARSGDVYDTRKDWWDGVRDDYENNQQALSHLVVLDGGGVPVMESHGTPPSEVDAGP